MAPIDLPRSSLRYLVLSGSSRDGSHNTRLATVAAEAMRSLGGETTAATIGDFDMPLYTARREAEGFPDGACRLRQQVREHDAVVLAAPEFNASISGPVKNMIDWLSRFRPQPFNETHMLLLSASPSLVGGNRGLWALRVPLEHLSARVYPDMFSLAQAHHAFTPDGGLADEVLQRRLSHVLAGFMALVEAAVNYPMTKHIWAEFPGEDSDDPAIARQE
jgi:chromate reductase